MPLSRRPAGAPPRTQLPRLLGAVALALCIGGGCTRCGGNSGTGSTSAAEGGASGHPRAKRDATTESGNIGDAGDAGDAAVQHGIRRFKGVDVPVWVDGVQAGVLRYGELPPQLAPTFDVEDEGKSPVYYSLHDYLVAIGVTPSKVKAVHVRDLRHKVGIVEGPELLKYKRELLFQFMGLTTGLALVHWSTQHLSYKRSLHEMSSVSVFVDKPVPPVDRERGCHTKGGTCTEEVPLVTGEAAKGTRIYVDGRLRGYVKRRLVSDNMVVGQDDKGPRYSIDKFIKSLEQDPSTAQTVELLTGDRVVARMSGANWAKHRDALVFSLEKHAHGKISLKLPDTIQAPDAGTSADPIVITSIQLYRAEKPVLRPVTPIDEVDLATVDGSGEAEE
jgi:hypothetical protein